jgi:hypothetical protein
MRQLAFLFVGVVLLAGAVPLANANAPGIERIVLIRHGEKPPKGLGQLTCQGLNRALMLPDFLANEFARPDYIFAPKPSQKDFELHGDGERYDYVRPLLTIGPTAIRLGMPMNTQIPFNDPGLLADTLMEPKYRNSTIYVGWEHLNIVLFTELMLTRFGSDATVPEWPNSDYNTVFELVLDWNEPKSVTLKIHSQDFGEIPRDCPTGAGG